MSSGYSSAGLHGSAVRLCSKQRFSIPTAMYER
jgi:hypothetical protein